MRISFSDFMAKTRPDGKGHIRILDEGMNVQHDIPFDEVVCDFCNDEITPFKDEEKTKENFLFLIGGYAICEKCHDGIHEKENKSVCDFCGN